MSKPPKTLRGKNSKPTSGVESKTKVSAKTPKPPKGVAAPIKGVAVQMVPPVADPPAAVAALPEKKRVSEVSGSLSSPVSVKAVAMEDAAAAPPVLNPLDAGAWAYPATLFEIAQINASFLAGFAERFAAATSPTDILALSREFSKEGSRLFEKQAATFLRMFAVGSVLATGHTAK